MDELAHSYERELRALMTASLDGDAEAYHALLTGHLRAYIDAALHELGMALQKRRISSRKY
jgi:hypothetical protein